MREREEVRKTPETLLNPNSLLQILTCLSSLVRLQVTETFYLATLRKFCHQSEQDLLRTRILGAGPGLKKEEKLWGRHGKNVPFSLGLLLTAPLPC